MLRKNSFPSLKKTEVSMPIVEANYVEIVTYAGPRKPPMPPFPEYEVDEEFSAIQSVSCARAENIDYNGYCTCVNREQQRQQQCKLRLSRQESWLFSMARHFACIHLISSYIGSL